MRVDVYLALVAAVTASLVLPGAARRLAPRPAALTLALGGLLSAGVWVGGGVLLTAALIGRLPGAALLGHWSAAVFSAHEPVPPVVGVLAGVLLVATLVVTAVALYRLLSEVARLLRLHREVAPVRCGDVAVVDSPRLEAVALPGWRGSIVLTTAMLGALDPAEQSVLLAHERSHLRHRHWLFRLAMRMAAAALPTLRAAVGPCDQALERWADEDAADTVGNRRRAATAVARAALAGAQRPAEIAAGISGGSGQPVGSVSLRVEALLAAPQPSRWRLLALPVAALTTATVAVLSAGSNLEDLFELARHL